MVLMMNSAANPTVQRFRLRSTSEPPPNGPAPGPTPKAPDSPASFPECMRIRKTTPTARNTWKTERTVYIRGPILATELVQLAQDLDRVGAQLAVEGAMVLRGELPEPRIELGVADLLVLRLAG